MKLEICSKELDTLRQINQLDLSETYKQILRQPYLESAARKLQSSMPVPTAEPNPSTELSLIDTTAQVHGSVESTSDYESSMSKSGQPNRK